MRVLSPRLPRWGRGRAPSATWASNDGAEAGPGDVPAAASPTRKPQGPTRQGPASAGSLGHPGLAAVPAFWVCPQDVAFWSRAVDPAGADAGTWRPRA